MELNTHLEAFEEKGLGVAALSYDSVEILKAFSDRRHIGFPLLSDPGSKIIRQYGLLNDVDYPVGHANYGLPYPGTYVIDAKGIILTKEFEKTYQERRTAASFLALTGDAPGASVSEIRNDQFSLRTSLSNATASVGQRVTLVLDFKMAPRMHAYAPGVKGYRPLTLRLVDNPLVTPHQALYPKAVAYTFEPLNETVPVFEGDFRMLQDITVVGPPRGAAPVDEINVSGTLDYQVCSDTLCYAPASLPVQWTLKFTPLDRQRAPEALQRKPQ